MTLSNWIGIGVTAIILIVGFSLYIHFRRKFKKMDGFEGIVVERGERPRRADFSLSTEEINKLEKELAKKK